MSDALITIASFDTSINWHLLRASVETMPPWVMRYNCVYCGGSGDRILMRCPSNPCMLRSQKILTLLNKVV